MHRIRVLEGVVTEREVLVEGFNSIESRESQDEDDDDGIVEDVATGDLSATNSGNTSGCLLTR